MAGALRPHAAHPQALPVGSVASSRSAKRDARAAVAGARHRAGQQAAQADAAGARLRARLAAVDDRGGHRRVDAEETGALQDDWEARGLPVPLRALDSPYREVTRPIVDYVADPPREPARPRGRVHPRVRRRALVGAAPAQPERPAAQDAPALHARGHGHDRAVAAGVVRGPRGPAGRPGVGDVHRGGPTPEHRAAAGRRRGRGRRHGGRARGALRRAARGAGRVRPARAARRAGGRPAHPGPRQRPVLARGRRRGGRGLARPGRAPCPVAGPGGAGAATGSTRRWTAAGAQGAGGARATGPPPPGWSARARGRGGPRRRRRPGVAHPGALRRRRRRSRRTAQAPLARRRPDRGLPDRRTREPAGVPRHRGAGGRRRGRGAGAPSRRRLVVVEPGPGVPEVPPLDAPSRPGAAARRCWSASSPSRRRVLAGAPGRRAHSWTPLVAAPAAPGERALDLYCGVGLFAAGLAARVATARSWGSRATPGGADARRNLHDRPWVRLERGGRRRGRRPCRGCDCRSGMSTRRWGQVWAAPTSSCSTRRARGRAARCVERVLALRPRVVAYVACDPASLARDDGVRPTWGTG